MFAVLSMFQLSMGLPAPAFLDTGIGWYVPGAELDALIAESK